MFVDFRRDYQFYTHGTPETAELQRDIEGQESVRRAREKSVGRSNEATKAGAKIVGNRSRIAEDRRRMNHKEGGANERDQLHRGGKKFGSKKQTGDLERHTQRTKAKGGAGKRSERKNSKGENQEEAGDVGFGGWEEGRLASSSSPRGLLEGDASCGVCSSSQSTRGVIVRVAKGVLGPLVAQVP